MKIHVIRRSGIAHDYNLKAAFVALPRSRSAAEIGKGPTNDNRVAVQILQDGLKRCVVESTIRAFVYDHFIFGRRQLGTNDSITEPRGIGCDRGKAIWHFLAAPWSIQVVVRSGEGSKNDRHFQNAAFVDQVANPRNSP